MRLHSIGEPVRKHKQKNIQNETKTNKRNMPHGIHGVITNYLVWSRRERHRHDRAFSFSVTGTKAEPSSLSSGLKTSLPVDSLPKSMSVMNDQQIKAQGLKSVGDIIDYTPGVNKFSRRRTQRRRRYPWSPDDAGLLPRRNTRRRPVLSSALQY